MDRREFLTYTGWLIVGSSVGSCANLSPRYVPPDKWTRPEETLLLNNVSVIDVERGRVRDERGILLQHGRIAALIREEQLPRVAADWEVDLGGAYVMPGIINAHCHMTLPGGVGFGPGALMAYMRQLERGAEECIKHGVTTVRDMLTISDWLDDLREKIGRGEIMGPRIVSCCAMDVGGGYGDKMTFLSNPKYWKEANNPSEAREAVRAALDEGAEFIKIFQQPEEVVLPGRDLPVMDTETVRAVCDEAACGGKVVALHHTTLSGMQRGLDAGVPCFEHLLRDDHVTDAEILRLLESRATLVPTASASLGLAHNRRGDPYWGKGMLPELVEMRDRIMPGLIREFCEPELVSSSLKYLDKFSDPDSYEKRHILPHPDQRHFTSLLVIGTENGKRYYRAGVNLGCGNDGGIPFAFPGAMALEMTLLEKLGFTPPDILRMATANNARLLGMGDRIGTVEKGKIADLVVFRKNPLETTRNTSHPSMVFKEGRLVFKL